MKIISVVEYLNKIDRSCWGHSWTQADRKAYNQYYIDAMNIYRGRTLTTIRRYQS